MCMKENSEWLEKQKKMEDIIYDLFKNKSFRNHSDKSRYIYNLVGNGSFENVVKRSLKDDLLELSMMDDQFKDEVPYIYGECYVDRFIMTYLLLRGFHHQKNNFDNFKVIVDDLKEYKARYMFLDISDFSINMDLIEFIFSNKYYKDLVNTREYLKMLYEKIGNIGFDSFAFFKDYEKYLTIYEDGKVLGSDEVVTARVFDKMIGNLLNNNKDSFYYNKILLFDNRFEYFNNSLYRVEENYYIRNEIVSLLDKFSVDMFNELNVDNYEDSFITSIGCVFDSDTYYEMFNKLHVIVEASELFDKGNKIDALEMIKSLNNEEHKERIGDKVVEFSSNSINIVEKPKTIIERMKVLYNRIDVGISYDFLDEVHETATGSSDIFDKISSVRKNPINKVKRLIMRKRKDK